jgi:hypothetical protein
MKYTRQTWRSFKIRSQEHLRNFKYVSGKSRFAQHPIDNGHAMGPLQDIMDVIHVRRKGKMMDTLEKFHIF